MFYLCESIKGLNDETIGFKVICKTSSIAGPRSSLYKVLEGPDFDCAKVEKSGVGSWVIIEDVEEKNNQEKTRQAKEKREYFLKNSQDFINEIDNFDDVKLVLKALIEQVFNK